MYDTATVPVGDAVADSTKQPPRRTVAVLATVASLIVVSLLVLTTSRAAFTDTTENEDNTWATGTVSLTDSRDSAGAMFNVQGMVPGDAEQHTIEVINESSATAVDVHLYGANLVDDDDLAQHLLLTISADDAALPYTGSVADFALLDGDSAVLPWNDVPPGHENDVRREYVITVEFDPAVTDTALGGAEAKVDFVWEAVSKVTRTVD